MTGGPAAPLPPYQEGRGGAGPAFDPPSSLRHVSFPTTHAPVKRATGREGADPGSLRTYSVVTTPGAKWTLAVFTPARSWTAAVTPLWRWRSCWKTAPPA